MKACFVYFVFQLTIYDVYFLPWQAKLLSRHYVKVKIIVTIGCDNIGYGRFNRENYVTLEKNIVRIEKENAKLDSKLR